MYITIRSCNVYTLDLMKQPIKIQLKPPKLLIQKIRKRYYKTLGNSLMNSPMSSHSKNSRDVCIFRFAKILKFAMITIYLNLVLDPHVDNIKNVEERIRGP